MENNVASFGISYLLYISKNIRRTILWNLTLSENIRIGNLEKIKQKISLIKQQLNISQYQDEIKELSSKIDVAENELNQNKQDLEQDDHFPVLMLTKSLKKEF